MPSTAARGASIRSKRTASDVDELDYTPSKSPQRSRTTTPSTPTIPTTPTEGRSKRQRAAESVEVAINSRRSSNTLAKPRYPKPEVPHVAENELPVHVSPSDGNIQDHKFQEIDASLSVNYLRKLECLPPSNARGNPRQSMDNNPFFISAWKKIIDRYDWMHPSASYRLQNEYISKVIRSIKEELASKPSVDYVRCKDCRELHEADPDNDRSSRCSQCGNFSLLTTMWLI